MPLNTNYGLFPGSSKSLFRRTASIYAHGLCTKYAFTAIASCPLDPLANRPRAKENSPTFTLDV